MQDHDLFDKTALLCKANKIVNYLKPILSKINMNYSLKKVRKKAMKEDNDLFSYPFRFISTIITKWLLKTNITPTTVTIIHVIIGIIASILFGFGQYNLTIIASILFTISFILDMVDGEIARYKEITSKIGGWLDHITDHMLLLFAMVGIALGNFSNTNDNEILILALFASIFTAMVAIIVIGKVIDPKLNQLKAVRLPFGFKMSKKIHLGSFTISFLVLTIGALLKQEKIMFYIYIIMIVLMVIKAFTHRIKLMQIDCE